MHPGRERTGFAKERSGLWMEDRQKTPAWLFTPRLAGCLPGAFVPLRLSPPSCRVGFFFLGSGGDFLNPLHFPPTFCRRPQIAVSSSQEDRGSAKH